jgi:hypothetical protein
LRRPYSRDPDQLHGTERNEDADNAGPLGHKGLYRFEKLVMWAIGIVVVIGLFVRMLGGMEGEAGVVLVFFLFVGAMLLLGIWGWGKAVKNTYNSYKDQQDRQAMRDEIDARTLRKLREEQGRGARGEVANEAVPRSATHGGPSSYPDRHCTNCGTQVRTRDRFCAACGQELAATDTDAEASR